MGRKRFVSLAALGLFAALAAQAQIGERNSHSLVESEAKPTAGSVSYLFPEQINLPAGKSTAIAMHFRVGDGLHINSHAPKDEYLIPTQFTIPAGSGVKLEDVTYPAGVLTTLALSPKEKFSVYTGEFTLLVRLVAEPGDHLMKAQLHYQACDNNACMPPRTLIVAVDVKGN